MDNEKFINICETEICNYYNSVYNRPPNEPIVPNDVFLSWVCKTVQNNKGLFGVKRKDGRYFECTHNADENEMYIDSYIKADKFIVRLEK